MKYSNLYPGLGLRLGSKSIRQADPVGARVMPSSGLGPPATMDSVTKDAASGIYCPTTTAEWTTTLAAAGISTGNPANAWGMQDSATPAADAIGAATLAGVGTSYLQAVAGWTRKAITIAEGGAGGSTSAASGDLAASGLMLGYVQVRSTPGALRTVMGAGSGAAHRYALMTTGPVYGGKDNNGGAEVDGVSNPGTTVHPLIIQVDRTAGAFRVITDQEIITPIYAAPGAGGLISYGASVGTSAPAGYLLGAYFTASAAEMTTAQIRTLLKVLRWTVAW